MPQAPQSGFAFWEVQLVRRTVSAYRYRYRCLEVHEFDDLVQDCLAHAWAVRQRLDLDPLAEPSFRFVLEVTRNWLMDKVRRLTAGKRFRALEQVSLDAPVDDPGLDLTLRDILPVRPQVGGEEAGIRECQLRLDLERVSALLTPRQRELCRLLAVDCLTVSDAAPRLGIRRSTVSEELIRIRRVCVRLLVDRYLED